MCPPVCVRAFVSSITRQLETRSMIFRFHILSFEFGVRESPKQFQSDRLAHLGFSTALPFPFPRSRGGGGGGGRSRRATRTTRIRLVGSGGRSLDEVVDAQNAVDGLLHIVQHDAIDRVAVLASPIVRCRGGGAEGKRRVHLVSWRVFVSLEKQNFTPAAGGVAQGRRSLLIQGHLDLVYHVVEACTSLVCVLLGAHQSIRVLASRCK